MVLGGPGQSVTAEQRPLVLPDGPDVLVRVLACAVCRTDLHLQDGDLAAASYPRIPGHEVIGDIVAAGADAVLQPGQRVGVAWLAWTCGRCEYCVGGQENLCERAEFHGCHRDGGFAEYLLADSRYCIPLAADVDPASTAPLLCAGLIGYRSLRMAGDGRRIGIYGFGAAAHIITQVARRQRREVYAFTRPGDDAAQAFARSLGATWVGDSNEPAPAPLDAALIFAPAGELVPKALRDVRKGGRVICAGIHMSDIPAFPYADLWGERCLQSVANLTRRDAEEFLPLATELELETRVTTYPLAQADAAMNDLRAGRLQGAAVLLA